MVLRNLNIMEMKRKDFEGLPCRDWNQELKHKITALVIIPGPAKRLHESGYRLLDFCACDGIHPICLLSGCSDVLHIDGIGGFGKDWAKKYGTCPKLIPPSGWSIDCLPASGFLRLFRIRGEISVGAALSSFECFAEGA